MAREDFRYKSEFRVRFGETDIQGVLFNGNYLLYVDTTQMDYLRRIGVTYADMRAQGHDILIVDEAHHLEEEATRHLGFELGQSRFDEHIQSLSGERGLFNEAVAAFRGSSAAATRRESVEKVVAETTAILPGVPTAPPRF